MKIAIFVHSLTRIGGIAKHTLYFARELMTMGHQVTVWAVEYDESQCYPELTKNLTMKTLRRASHPITSETKKPFGIRMLHNLWLLWKCYQDQHKLSSLVPEGYDIVNAHGNTINWAAAEYKRTHGIPVVWMCNDFWPVASQRYKIVSDTWHKVKHIIKESLYYPFAQYDQAAVREIDKIAVLSELVAFQMKEHYGVNPIVVRKGVDSMFFTHGDDEHVRERYGARKESFLVLTVCSLMPRRRLEDVIRAIRILVEEGIDVTYMIVGRMSHTPDYTRFVQTEISSSNLSDHVILTGEISEEMLVDCYSACDVFVWPSDGRQSWGSAGMEAMAAGKPIIVSKANGLAEILEDGVTALLVTPRSPEKIANAIKRLMADSALATSLANQGHKLMRDGYSWHIYAESMLALFQAAINR